MTFLRDAADRQDEEERSPEARAKPRTTLWSRRGLLRAALSCSEDYRAGRLPKGELTLPPELRSLSPSGYAYAGRTEVFVQMWQNWRHESGTGLAYFADPPTEQTMVNTAEGDTGHPQREVGDGWWWVS